MITEEAAREKASRRRKCVQSVTFEQGGFRAGRRRRIIFDEFVKKMDQRKLRREQIRFGVLRLIVDERLKMIIVGERLQFGLFGNRMLIGPILRRRRKFSFFLFLVRRKFTDRK